MYFNAKIGEIKKNLVTKIDLTTVLDLEEENKKD